MKSIPRKDNGRALYLSFMFLMCLSSVVICFWGLLGLVDVEMSPFHEIDLCINTVFWVEYITQLILSSERGEYLKESFFELVSILPYSPEFQILHAFRLMHFVRLMLLFPALPKKFTGEIRRWRLLVKRFLDEKKLVFVLMAGALIILSTVFVLSEIFHVYYFAAFGNVFSAPFLKAALAYQIGAGICYGVLSICVLYLLFALGCFLKRLKRNKRAVD